MDNKVHIENVIRNTFKTIGEVYKTNKEEDGAIFNSSDSRIIFPRKRMDKKIRISEQELRFIFVEQFNKYLLTDEGKEWDVYYSVETPTEHGYIGFKSGDPDVDDEKGQSGNVDLCIHDKKGKRIGLIEFKALNPAREDYIKDFCKLENENARDTNIGKYFLQIVDNVNSGTMPNIKGKIEEYCSGNITYSCYCLQENDYKQLPKDSDTNQ